MVTLVNAPPPPFTPNIYLCSLQFFSNQQQKKPLKIGGARLKTKKGVSLFRIFWVIFLIFIAIFFVYLYRLHIEGTLGKHLLQISNEIAKIFKKNPILIWLLLSYIVIFYFGYLLGKNRK